MMTSAGLEVRKSRSRNFLSLRALKSSGTPSPEVQPLVQPRPDSDDAGTWDRFGKESYMNGDYEAALKYFERALELDS